MNSFFFKATSFFFRVFPFWGLYLLSDILRFFIYRIFKYRYKVVSENLKVAFPEKSLNERKLLTKAFYRHLSDITLEGLKGLGISKALIKKRYHFINPELLTSDYEKGQSIILLGSHSGNWEWGVLSVCLWIKHSVVGIYKPMKNKKTDAFFNQNRQKWGLELTSMTKTGRTLVQKRNTTTAFVFIADQSPSDVKNAHWLTFFNRKTAFHHGMEKIARRTNYPVYLFNAQRVKRGYYELTFSLLCTSPKDLKEKELTQLYADALEKTIRENPANWLWSHRRWKRSFKNP